MSISAAKQQASLRVFTWAEWQYDLGANSVDLEPTGLGHILALEPCDFRQVIYLSVSQF